MRDLIKNSSRQMIRDSHRNTPGAEEQVINSRTRKLGRNHSNKVNGISFPKKVYQKLSGLISKFKKLLLCCCGNNSKPNHKPKARIAFETNQDSSEFYAPDSSTTSCQKTQKKPMTLKNAESQLSFLIRQMDNEYTNTTWVSRFYTDTIKCKKNISWLETVSYRDSTGPVLGLLAKEQSVATDLLLEMYLADFLSQNPDTVLKLIEWGLSSNHKEIIRLLSKHGLVTGSFLVNHEPLLYAVIKKEWLNLFIQLVYHDKDCSDDSSKSDALNVRTLADQCIGQVSDPETRTSMQEILNKVIQGMSLEESITYRIALLSSPKVRGQLMRSFNINFSNLKEDEEDSIKLAVYFINLMQRYENTYPIPTKVTDMVNSLNKKDKILICREIIKRNNFEGLNFFTQHAHFDFGQEESVMLMVEDAVRHASYDCLYCIRNDFLLSSQLSKAKPSVLESLQKILLKSDLEQILIKKIKKHTEKIKELSNAQNNTSADNTSILIAKEKLENWNKTMEAFKNIRTNITNWETSKQNTSKWMKIKITATSRHTRGGSSSRRGRSR